MAGMARAALPLLGELGATQRRVLDGAFATLLAILVLMLAYAMLGAGDRELAGNWPSFAVFTLVAAIVAVRAGSRASKRGPWILLAAGIALYALGNLMWAAWLAGTTRPSTPWVSDALCLILYPLAGIGIVGLAWGRDARRLPAGDWLDAIIAGAGFGALGAALVLHPVLSPAGGSSLAGGGSPARLTELAYPAGDLVLAALVLGFAGVRGWPLNRTWKLLAIGFFVLALADSMSAVHGSTGAAGWTNLLYVIAAALLAAAAWQTDAPDAEAKAEPRSALLVPVAFALAALALLVYDHVHSLDPLVLTLSAVTLLAAIVRMAITFRDLIGLAEARRQAATDELTALPNRRLFVTRTRDAITAARIAGGELSVLIIDLDNFKELNDTLGHQAGDELLRMIGPRLRQALRRTDTVARIGGDAFALLLDPQPEDGGASLVADKVRLALREPFETGGLKLRLTASIGIASYPAHAADVDELMQRADIAMHSAKAAKSGYEFYTQRARPQFTRATDAGGGFRHCARRGSDRGPLSNRWPGRCRGGSSGLRRWFAGGGPTEACSCRGSSSRRPSKPASRAP